AVVAVPDGGADDGAAAHGVADQVVVQAVAPQHPVLAQVAELRVTDRAGRATVIHRVAARLVGSAGLDDHIAAQVGDLAAVVAGAEVQELQRLVQLHVAVADAGDDAFFGLRGVLVRGDTVGCGDDDAVADSPPRQAFAEGDAPGARFGIGS